MTRFHRLLLAAATAAGFLAGCKNARPVSRDIHEAPRTSAFPHEKHGGFDCVDCHTGIPKATRLGEAKLPGQVKCEECHDIKNPTDDQSRKVVAALATLKDRPQRDYQITFNHVDHLKRIKAKEPNQVCATCHKVLPEAGVTAKVTPAMQACLSCHYHAEEVAQAKCQPCHVSLRRYPLKPIEALVGLSHTAEWIHEHQRYAKNTAETCAVCHDQTFCANCHATSTAPFRAEIRFPEKIESGFIHRNDYVSRHQIEVQADPAMCRRCHGSFFCDSCHTAQNISYRNVLAGGNPPRVHPPNWSNNVGAGPELFHGDAARANIVSCAGCHDQGARAICTSCHRSNGPGSAGPGGDPHPPDFRAHHKRDEINKTPMCRACHFGG
jgi:hypothetical protein